MVLSKFSSASNFNILTALPCEQVGDRASLEGQILPHSFYESLGLVVAFAVNMFQLPADD